MRIAIIIGTRPQFIDMAPVIHELVKLDKAELLIYDTGQHYDDNLAGIFMRELAIPAPKSTFKSDGTHAQQTGAMMIQTEAALMRDRPDLVVVEGDTNSTMAAALAAAKLNIPVSHIEAGCRIFDLSIPEEINRVVTDHVATTHYAATQNCINNLESEGLSNNIVTGHPIVSSIELVRDRLLDHIDINGYETGRLEYYYVTLHRDFNVDDRKKLEYILEKLARLKSAVKRDMVFPLHPRTKKRITEFKLDHYLGYFRTCDPVGYIESISLVKNAFAVITDSGGLQREALILGTPCFTVRPSTEWVETLNYDANRLIKDDSDWYNIPNMKPHHRYNISSDIVRHMNTLLGTPDSAKKIAHAILTKPF